MFPQTRCHNFTLTYFVPGSLFKKEQPQLCLPIPVFVSWHPFRQLISWLAGFWRLIMSHPVPESRHVCVSVPVGGVCKVASGRWVVGGVCACQRGIHHQTCNGIAPLVISARSTKSVPVPPDRTSKVLAIKSPIIFPARATNCNCIQAYVCLCLPINF